MRLPVRSVLAVAGFVFASSIPLSAQAGPDVHVGELLLGPGSVEIRAVYNATDRPGYDNQPWFTPDGMHLLYAREGDEGATDIYRYALADRTSTQLTRTPGDELSPSMLDGESGFLTLSNGGIEGAPWGLWRFTESGDPIAPLIDPIFETAYYGVANDDVVLGWLNDENGTLVWANRHDGTVTRIRDRVAPSHPQRIPGDDGMSIVEPDFVGQMWLKRLELGSWELTPIAPAVGDGWHYAWTPDGRILMADGEAIFVLDPDSDEEWSEVARFPGVGDISRIVVSPDGTRIAFVAAGS